MDGSRFDAWTRRRFGLVTGGALAAALGLAVEAKTMCEIEVGNDVGACAFL